MHGIDTECIQCGISEVLERIGHESHIEYIVQFVVFTPCLDIECILQFHHVIIFILWYHLSLHVVDALLSCRHDGVVQRVVRLNKSIEHGFLPCQQIDVLVTPLLAPRLTVLALLILNVHVEVQVPFMRLSHDGSERTAENFNESLN